MPKLHLLINATVQLYVPTVCPEVSSRFNHIVDHKEEPEASLQEEIPDCLSCVKF